MFGQSSTPFGSPQGFGSTNTTFGASPAPAFGGGTGFGAAPAPASGFGFGGAPAPAPSSGFGFGAAPSPAPAFGASTGGFGSTSTPFGAAPAPSGGLFGAPAPAPSGGFGAFGSPAPAPAFGAPSPAPSGFGSSGGGLFGSTPAPSTSGFGATGGFGAAPSTFGAPAPAPTGLFGAPSPAPAFGSSGFGNSSTSGTTSLFGAPSPAPSGGLFGGSPSVVGQGQGQGGTKGTPYQVISRQDGTSSINLQTITAMPAYEAKSLDELRFEDYSQGNRGSGTPGASGGFSAPASSGFGSTGGGLFGSTPAPAPGGGFGTFGSPAPAPAFGAPSPAPSGFGAFGSPTPAPAFGAPSPAPGGLFGSSPAPAPSGFGSTGGGLFGSTPAPAPGGFGTFGSPTPAPAFGAASPAPGGFGSGGLFGSSPAPAPSGFGSTGGGLFGSTPAPAPGGFGAFGSPAPAPAFGAPSPGGFGSGGLFGSSQAPAPSGFGSTGGGLFGSTPAPAPGGFGFASRPAGPMSAPGFASAPPPNPPVGSIIPPAANEVLMHQMTALENQRKELEKMDSWKGKSSTESSIVSVSNPDNEFRMYAAPRRTMYMPYRASSPKSTARIRPRGFAAITKQSAAPNLNAIGSGNRPMAPDSYAASSSKMLVIQESSKPKLRLAQSKAEEKTPEQEPLRLAATSFRSPSKDEQPAASATSERPSSTATTSNLTSPSVQPESTTPRNSSTKSPASAAPGYDYYKKVTETPDTSSKSPRKSEINTKIVAPKLTKEGYWTSPPIPLLEDLSEADLAAVLSFKVGRDGFGEIAWEGAVDVRNADLDRIIDIDQGTLSVYMLDEAENKKPPEGAKLNRPAVLTFYNIFPAKGGANADEATKVKFAKKIERSTAAMGAKLISYETDTGEWKIRVNHFSRYGLILDDDSESGTETDTHHFESGERGGRSRASIPNGQEPPAQTSRLQGDTAMKAAANDIEGKEHGTTGMGISDGDGVGTADTAGNVLAEYDSAYGYLSNLVRASPTMDDMPIDNSEFPDEGQECMEHPPTEDDVILNESDLAIAENIPSSHGICARLAKKVSLGKSSVDFGLRMGKSFRVGWSPDGSFLRLSNPGSGTLVRCRPVFTTKDNSEERKQLALITTHHENSINSSGEATRPTLTLRGENDKTDEPYHTLKSYALYNKDDRITSEAFSLLSCFVGGYETSLPGELVVVDDEGHDSKCTLKERQMYAVSRWLSESCSAEVDKEIAALKTKNDVHGALLSAITGGNIEKACDIAHELGYPHLSAMLASGDEGRSDILQQVHSWTDNGVATKLSEKLLRVYLLIGGDLKMEEQIFKKGYSLFDWRRRLVMDLVYGSSNGSRRDDLSEAIRMYETNLKRGTVPHPRPHYSDISNTSKVRCLLYRLLCLCESPCKVPLTDLIDPKGYTKYEHDFSLAFHMAAAITAMGKCDPFGQREEQNLISGYMAQLLESGHWEWAVYVSLCSLGSYDENDEYFLAWKENRTKDLVLRHYNSGNEKAHSKRRFLEDVGVPTAWFEEALALRCAIVGDSIGYLTHMVSFSPNDAIPVLEEMLIPNMLFMPAEKVAEALKLVKIFSVSENSLAGCVYDFFQLHERLVEFEQASSVNDFKEQLPEFLEACECIENILVNYRAKYSDKSFSEFIAETRVVPMQCFLSEALAQIAYFKLRIMALQMGGSTTNLKYDISYLVPPESVVESGMSMRENIGRWLL